MAGAGAGATPPSLLTPRGKMRLMLPKNIIHPRDAKPDKQYLFKTSDGEVIGKLHGFRPMFKGEIESAGVTKIYRDIEIYPWVGEGLPWSLLEVGKRYYFIPRSDTTNGFEDSFKSLDRISNYGFLQEKKQFVYGKDYIVDYAFEDIDRAMADATRSAVLPENVRGKIISNYMGGTRRSRRRVTRRKQTRKN